MKNGQIGPRTKNSKFIFGLTLVAPLMMTSSKEVNARPETNKSDVGVASVYSDDLHGKHTASGEKYNKHALTAASNKFPIGSLVHVKHKFNGKTVVVRINDIQARTNRRLLDLSKAAAKQLNIDSVAPVSAKVVK